MSEKTQREAYIRASDKRVENWSESKRDAFNKAVDRLMPVTNENKENTMIKLKLLRDNGSGYDLTIGNQPLPQMMVFKNTLWFLSDPDKLLYKTCAMIPSFDTTNSQLNMIFA